MSAFSIRCELSNLPRTRSVAVPKTFVDPDSEFTRIPESLLKQIGVRVEKNDVQFLTASGHVFQRPTGYAILRAQGFETVDEVIFGQEGDVTLLGARTLLGFRALVDSRRKRLLPVPRIVSSSQIEPEHEDDKFNW